MAFFENEFRNAFAEEASRRASGTKKDALEKALNEEQVKIDNFLAFIEQGASQAVAGRLREAEERVAKLKAELQALATAATEWEPPPTKAIRNELLRLRDNLTGDDPASAKPMLKALVGELKLYPEKLTDAAEPVVKNVEEKKKTVKSEKTPAKEKGRATWGFRVVGQLFLENILVPIAGDQVCPPDVAGARRGDLPHPESLFGFGSTSVARPRSQRGKSRPLTSPSSSVPRRNPESGAHFAPSERLGARFLRR